MTQKHTPTPWEVSYYDYDNNGPIYCIENVTRSTTPEEHKANAEFIVRACNAHDDLVEALKYSRKFIPHNHPDKPWEEIDAALAKAGAA